MRAPYSPRQGQFLAFIHQYATLHGRPPAEAEMAQFFQVTPPSAHLMILTLERRGLINRVPGQPRSISLRLLPETLPSLRGAGVSSAIPAQRPSPGQPDETLEVNAMLLRLGRIQLDDLFAHKGEHPVDDADSVRLLNVLIQPFVRSGVGAPLVQRLRRHACNLFHRYRQAAAPETTFEEDMKLMLDWLSDLPAWREALHENLGATHAAQAPEPRSATPRSFAMTDIQKRNQHILQLSREGVGHEEIARLFRISRTNIDRIVRRFDDERRLAEKHNKLLARIRQANDLDAAWSTADLIDAIRPPPVIRTRLKEHFAGLNTDWIALRFLMDITIPAKGAPEADLLYPPLFKVVGVGKKGYWSIVHRLTDLDLGDEFEREWLERLASLRRAQQISGPLPYAGSNESLQP